MSHFLCGIFYCAIFLVDTIMRRVAMTKILLVEDDKSIIENLTEFLQSEGYQVKNASGQTSALQLINSELFDLVLLDISLEDVLLVIQRLINALNLLKNYMIILKLQMELLAAEY